MRFFFPMHLNIDESLILHCHRQKFILHTTNMIKLSASLLKQRILQSGNINNVRHFLPYPIIIKNSAYSLYFFFIYLYSKTLRNPQMGIPGLIYNKLKNKIIKRIK